MHAKARRRFPWQNVLFSDEKTFEVGSGPSRAWQNPHDRVTRSSFRHPQKLHVWAAAGYYMKCDLFFFTQNLNSALYTDIIKKRLTEKKIRYASDAPASLRKKWPFLQDNSRIHKSGISMQTLTETLGNRLIDHPPQSPDLNIVEDLWSYLNRKVQEANVKDLKKLKSVLQREWRKMRFEIIRTSVDSMSARLKEVINLDGQRTHY